MTGAAERWLRALTDAQQSVVAELFFAAMAEDCDTPNAICRHAVQSLRLRIEEADAAERPGLRRIESHLCSHTTGALAFAADRLAWSKLSEEEQKQRREASRQEYRERLLQRQKERLAAWAQGGARG